MFIFNVSFPVSICWLNCVLLVLHRSLCTGRKRQWSKSEWWSRPRILSYQVTNNPQKCQVQKLFRYIVSQTTQWHHYGSVVWSPSSWSTHWHATCIPYPSQCHINQLAPHIFVFDKRNNDGMKKTTWEVENILTIYILFHCQKTGNCFLWKWKLWLSVRL